MKKILKEIPATEGKLFEISEGRRLPIADFDGRIEITEEERAVLMLGELEKHAKRIRATFIICGNLNFFSEHGLDGISSAKVYEASVTAVNRLLHLSGMKFEDSDPIRGELVFSIPDKYLIKKLMEES